MINKRSFLMCLCPILVGLTSLNSFAEDVQNNTQTNDMTNTESVNNFFDGKINPEEKSDNNISVPGVNEFFKSEQDNKQETLNDTPVPENNNIPAKNITNIPENNNIPQQNIVENAQNNVTPVVTQPENSTAQPIVETSNLTPKTTENVTPINQSEVVSTPVITQPEIVKNNEEKVADQIKDRIVEDAVKKLSDDKSPKDNNELAEVKRQNEIQSQEINLLNQKINDLSKKIDEKNVDKPQDVKAEDNLKVDGNFVENFDKLFSLNESDKEKSSDSENISLGDDLRELFDEGKSNVDNTTHEGKSDKEKSSDSENISLGDDLRELFDEGKSNVDNTTHEGRTDKEKSSDSENISLGDDLRDLFDEGKSNVDNTTHEGKSDKEKSNVKDPIKDNSNDVKEELSKILVLTQKTHDEVQELKNKGLEVNNKHDVASPSLNSVRVRDINLDVNKDVDIAKNQPAVENKVEDNVKSNAADNRENMNALDRALSNLKEMKRVLRSLVQR